MKGCTYLLVNLLSVLFPFLFSFAGPWRAGGREWLRLLAAVALVALPFVAWDMAFTGRGLWSFNPAYLTGASLLGLPLEEVLFFVCIPFACLFIYRVVKAVPRLSAPRRLLRPLWLGLAGLLLAAAVLADGRAYSQAAFGLAGLLLLVHAVRLPAWSGAFLAALAFHYLPFLLVNGLLTALPVVSYDPAGILGPRIGSIPVEDAAYSLALLLLNVSVYEALGAPAGRALRGEAGVSRRARLRQARQTQAPHAAPEAT